MLEFIFELLGEFLLQVVGEALIEIGFHSLAEPFRRPPNPWLAAISNVSRHMKHRCAIALSLIALTTMPAVAKPCDTMPTDLAAMVAVDQALRSHLTQELGSVNNPPPKIAEQTMLVDRENTARLKELLTTCGWPKKSRHGARAVSDAWLIAQHADQNPQFQKWALRLIEVAVRDGEAPSEPFAYLSDRVATSQGRPQLYGTQFKLIGECTLEFFPMDGERAVEARRKAFGMPTLEEYRAQVVEQALPSHCSARPGRSK